MKTLRATTNDTDDREAYIRRALAAGIPLYVIRQYLDWEDSFADQKVKS